MNLLVFAVLLKIVFAQEHQYHSGTTYPSKNINHVYTVPLGSEASFHWRVDLIGENIIAEVHYVSEENSWFAIGFSDYGELKPADYCIVWMDWHRDIKIQDAWADEAGTINLDSEQNCDNFDIRRKGNVTKFTFTRKFDTCDDHDYVIEGGNVLGEGASSIRQMSVLPKSQIQILLEWTANLVNGIFGFGSGYYYCSRGTTHLVWLKGRGPLSSLAGLTIDDAQYSGMSRTEMLRSVHMKPEFPPNTWNFEILNDKVKVPDKETTYWCRVYKLSPALSEKHHILQFGPVIEKGSEHLVHHMEVFYCAGQADLEIPLYNGPCDSADRPQKTQICKKVLAAWAMGADAFVYPEDAGLSIGGPNFNRYVMLEVHYNNPELQENKIDSSGIQFFLTKSLRKYDAGVMELGLEYTDKMAIPPQQESFPLSGHCIMECTGVGLPMSGIKIFGSQLHTHLTGTRVTTRHVRNGEELPLLNYDNHYSTHFQEIRLLPEHVTILPGDALITTCTYNTMKRNNVTLGGFSISDEMCVNYIHYYPNTRLEVCKSAISDDALRTYFRYMREWENQATSNEKVISENYQSIEWTRVRTVALHDLYEAAPLGMQCNGSDGSRLPGLWDNIGATQVRLPLPPPARNCPEPESEANLEN